MTDIFQTESRIQVVTVGVAGPPGGASGITAEGVRDVVAAFLEEGDNIEIEYDDSLDILTISSTASGASGGLSTEQVTDLIGDTIVGSSSITATFSDGSDTVTLTIPTGGVTNAMLAGSIDLAKLATDPLARANHTGTQTSSTISNFTEAVQDVVGAALVAGDSITIDYDDPTGFITIETTSPVLTAEDIRDTIGAALVEGSGIDITVNDGGDTITIGFAADMATQAELDLVEDKIDQHTVSGNAHAASTIGYNGSGTISATNVEGALDELDSEKAATASAVMDGDSAGGVLSGTYPNPGFAADMATQAELDAHIVANPSHAASTISGFDEAVDDRVSSLIVAGSGISTTYDDGANTLEIDVVGGYTTGILGRYRADAATVGGNPASGHMRWDNATQVDATELTIDHLDLDQFDLDNIFLFINDGDTLLIQDKDNSENRQVWEITGTPTGSHAATFWTFPVTLTSSNGTGTTGFPDSTIVLVGVFHATGGGDVTQEELDAHVMNANAHAASVIAFDPNGSISATNVQAAIQEVRDEAGVSGYSDEDARDAIGTALTEGAGVEITVDDLGDTITISVDPHIDAGHSASTISYAGSANISANNVEAALDELDSEKAATAAAVMDGDTAGGVLSGTYPNPGFASDMATQAELDAHIFAVSGAHNASSIAFAPGASIVATDVQEAIEELSSETVRNTNGRHDGKLILEPDSLETVVLSSQDSKRVFAQASASEFIIISSADDVIDDDLTTAATNRGTLNLSPTFASLEAGDGTYYVQLTDAAVGLQANLTTLDMTSSSIEFQGAPVTVEPATDPAHALQLQQFEEHTLSAGPVHHASVIPFTPDGSIAATNIQAAIEEVRDEAGGAGLVDSDYGDITVSGSGTVMTIDNDVVTNAKSANMAESTIKGRAAAAGTGDPTDLTATQVRTIINVEDGADVTDAANVDAAGAVMNSDTSTASMSFVIDEDSFATDSATVVPTQQSVKAYVDAHINDSSAAHAATAISYAGGTGMSATNVESAIDELASEKFNVTGGSISGPVTITDPGNAPLIMDNGTAAHGNMALSFFGTPIFSFKLATGDANPALTITPLTGLSFGAGGGSSTDWALNRTAANIAALASGDKLQQNAAPTTGDDLTNKTYVDSGTVTLTNKRITRRVTSQTGNSPTWNTDNCDQLTVTSITGAINLGTNMTLGTHVAGDRLIVALTGNGTHAITWGSNFEASGNIALPTALGATGVRLDVGFIWNTATSKFRCVGYA